MASTLTPTTFKVKIIEEHVVRNNVNKNEVVFEIGGVTNVDHRIVTCPNNTSIDLLDNSFHAAVIISSSQGTYTQNLRPTSSIFISDSNVTSSNFNGSFGDDIEYVKIYAISSSIDIEYTLINS
mgnify:CR=1 FL=1